MKSSTLSQLALICLCNFVAFVSCDRTSKKIYIDINSYAACFRRFNATHQIGCNSNREGNVGVLHYIESDVDTDWLLNVGPHQPYVALLTYNTFNKVTMDRLKASGKVSGVLVIFTNNTDEIPDEFSPDKSCPNDLLSVYDNTEYAHCSNITWNRRLESNSLFFYDYPFPIMAVRNSIEVEESLLKNCYEKYNKPDDGNKARDYPLCSAEVKVAMDGAKDTPTCIRRSNLQNNINPQKYCDPLEFWSVYGFALPVNNTVAENSIILASARMDAFSMFEDIYPSADSAVSGIVSLLAAAEALGKVKADLDPRKPILFTFLNGEAFDYIGSQRLLYDMEQTGFPWNSTGKAYGPPLIEMKHFHHMLEVSQVGLSDEGKLWIHTDPLSLKDPQVEGEVDDLINHLKQHADVSVDEASRMQPLPPASFQTFLHKRNFSGIVLTDHKTTYTNKFYNSRFDSADNIGHTYPPDLSEDEKYNYLTDAAVKLAKVASTIAKTLYSLNTGNDDTSNVVVDNKTVTNLLYCFLVSPQCELLNYTMTTDDYSGLKKESLSYYIGVRIGQAYSHPFIPIKSLLGYYFSNKVQADNRTHCEEKRDFLYDYVWIRGAVNESSPDKSRIGECREITSNLTLAKSPAFDIDGYDWSSNKYSAWTESRWGNDAISLRVFLIPSPQYEGALLGVGLSMTVISLFIVYCCNKHSKILLQPQRRQFDD